jgi:hypothetical protein
MLLVTEIMDHACKIAPAIRFEFAVGQVQRKRRAIFAPTASLATDADDLLDAGLEVVAQIAFMLGLVRLWRQHLDILAGQFRSSVTEKAFRRPIDGFDPTTVINRDDGRYGRLQDAAKLSSLGFR